VRREGAGGVNKHPGMHGLLCNLLSTHRKANRNQGTRSGDGGSTSTTTGTTTSASCSWPKFGNFLIIPYGFHGTIHSHHENRIIARGSYHLWLGTSDKDRFAVKDNNKKSQKRKTRAVQLGSIKSR
jgi:hypothetical protein